MSDPQHRSESVDRQLESMLVEAEETVARLRRELDARRVAREDATSLAEQHAEIDRLREHLAEAQVRWDEVGAFFDAALKELLHSGERPDDTEPAAHERPDAEEDTWPTRDAS